MGPFAILSSSRAQAPMAACLAPGFAVTQDAAGEVRRMRLATGRSKIAMTAVEIESVALWRRKGLRKVDACALVFGRRG